MALNEVQGTAHPLRHRVAAEVRAWRARRSMTQVQLARALGISQAQVSARLRGETPITLDEIEHLADIFGCTAEDLMRPALTDTTAPQEIRVASAQKSPGVETLTVSDQLADRRKRRRVRDLRRPLTPPVIGDIGRRLQIVAKLA